MRKPIIEVDGKRYMDTKSAAKLWDIKPGTVARYCSQRKIPGAFKDTSGKWCIPISSIKPLTDEQIRHILTLTVKLKNNPENAIDYSMIDVNTDKLLPVYEYLVSTGYIVEFNKDYSVQELPYKIQLTDKGMDLVLSKKAINKVDFQEAVFKWSSIIKIILMLKDLLE